MKKISLQVAIILLSATTVFSQIPNYVPSNGLVGWWPFSGNANDVSGNGNNGVVSNSVLSSDRFGNSNSCYYFDGNNDYIKIPTNILSTAQSTTISIWVLVENTISRNVILSVGDSTGTGGSNGNHYSLEVYPNSIDPTTASKMIHSIDKRICESTNNPYRWLSDTTYSFQPMVWNHIVITSDGVQTKYYRNGQLITNLYQGVPVLGRRISDLCAGMNYFWLGKRKRVGEEFLMKGKLDDLGMWNRVLTDCEILDLYNTQLGSFANSTISINPSSSAIGSNAILSIATPIQNLQWQSNPSNIGWTNLVNNSFYSGVTSNTLGVSNVQLSNHNQQFRVVACAGNSNIASIQITDTCISNITVYDTTYVTVYDTLLTTVTDTLIINTTLGLPAPNNENTILIYPNPASDQITIDNGNYIAMSGYSIKIENNAGQQVFQSTINQAQFILDLSTWTGNGLYFVHLIDPQNNTVTVRKIILQ
jgi:hypothetical protein